MQAIRKADLCDTTGIPADLVNVLAALGLVFATAKIEGPIGYAGDVIAPDWSTAEAVAAIKGRGDVVGQVVEVG